MSDGSKSRAGKTSESAEPVCTTETKNGASETESEPEERIYLTASEIRFLRRFCLTLKTRTSDLWRNREKLRTNKLHVLKELAFIRDEAAFIYDAVTDAVWRELNKEDNHDN